MDEKIRAAHAQALLDNPVFTEALEQVQIGINRDLEQVTEPEDAFRLALLRQASANIITYIVASAESPKISDFNALQKQRKTV